MKLRCSLETKVKVCPLGLWKISIQFSVFFLLPALKTKSKQNKPQLRFFWSLWYFAFCKFKPQMLSRLACVTLLERTPPSHWLPHLIKGWFFFLASRFYLLETAYIWVCMSVMPHKEKHKYFQSVLCSETVHKCFSFCSSDGFAIVWLMHVHVKTWKLAHASVLN